MMDRQDRLIKDYYSRYQDKIIECPFQPGNLKISKMACVKRFKAAGRITGVNSNSENSFNYFVSQGLLRCRSCRMVSNLTDWESGIEQTKKAGGKKGRKNRQNRIGPSQGIEI